MTRKVINKNIIELKREGYVPGLPAQGPISLPKELVDKLGLGVSGNTIYSLQLVNPIKGERVNFIYTDTDIKTHNDILEWCDSFIDFTTWSVEIVCIATSLEFEDDNNFDHPKLANLELENLAKYIAEKFDCKTKTNDNEIEISLSWSGNSRLIGEAQINEIEIELNSISLIEKIGLSIKRIQWIDPKTFARFGDITHILHPNRSEIKKLSDIQRTSKKLYRLLSSINGYYTQLSIRSKIILGFQLIEDYALDGQNPSLLEFNSEKKEAAKEKKPLLRTSLTSLRITLQIKLIGKVMLITKISLKSLFQVFSNGR
jgi:hypothetical protein